MSFTANIQTPGAQGATLLIRPSLDTGLFTAAKLSTTLNNATADIGIMVCVQVDGGATQVFPKTNLNITGGTTPGSTCVVYDQRIQQVSNTLFGIATACLPTATTTACTTDAQCVTATGNPGATCSGGFCILPPTVNPAGCNFELLLTTLSVHSFDFVAPISNNGSHPVTMTWGLIGTGSSTVGGSVAACVGPAEVTIQQVKNFSNDSTIVFQ